MFKKIHFIINPASGQDEPILTYINDVFRKSDIEWEVLVTKTKQDAENFAKKFQEDSDLIAVYGGDGTVMEVAEALFGKPTPMAIIPGGTANVMAKELGLPATSLEALKLIREGGIIKPIDMGLINDSRFLIRINVGILADIVKDTNRSSKRKFGQLAYVVNIFKNFIFNENKVHYDLVIDGRKIKTAGVALVIANSGNVGIPGLSFLPDISVSDGLLDVILIRNSDIGSLMKLAGGTLLQTKIPGILKRWKGKEISLKVKGKQSVIKDDITFKEKDFEIKVMPSAINILVPDKT